jgi:hypothetical protein
MAPKQFEPNNQSNYGVEEPAAALAGTSSRDHDADEQKSDSEPDIDRLGRQRVRSPSPPVRPAHVPPPALPPAPPPADIWGDAHQRAVRSLLLQLLEKKSIHHETQASVAGTLEIIRAALGAFLPPELVAYIPRTWHKLMAFMRPHLPKFDVIHSCPNECGTFFVDELDEKTKCPTEGCGGVRFDPNGKPTMTTHYFPLIERIRARYACAPFAKLMEYPHTRAVGDDGSIADVQDGVRWRHSFIHHFGESQYNLCLSVSSDSFPIDKKKKRSVTPVIAQLLNLPPWLRTKIGAQLLLMEVPSRAKKVGIYLKLLMRDINLLQQIKGVRMWNAHIQQWIRVRCTILFDNNDIVAAPKISGTRGSGSINGACHVCDVVGLHVPALGTRIYLGAHRFLHHSDPLRYRLLVTCDCKQCDNSSHGRECLCSAEWQRIFGSAEAKDWCEYDEKSGVQWRTHQEAVRAGIVSELSPYLPTSKHHPSHKNGYRERSMFTRDVIGWNAVESHGVDMMHQGPNFGRDLVHLMGNMYRGIYTERAHEDEMERRRGQPHVPGWRPKEDERPGGTQVNHPATTTSTKATDRRARKSAKDRGPEMAEADEESKEEKHEDEDDGVDMAMHGTQVEPEGEPQSTGPASSTNNLSRQPWQLTKVEQIEFDQRCESLRLPYRDSHMPALFGAEHAADFRIKSAHWWIFLGPVGVWLMLGCTSIAPEVRDAFCDALWWCHQITGKDFQREELKTIEEEGHRVFTRLEMLLPLRMASIARHYLSHACWFIRHFGPLHTHWQ